MIFERERCSLNKFFHQDFYIYMCPHSLILVRRQWRAILSHRRDMLISLRITIRHPMAIPL